MSRSIHETLAGLMRAMRGQFGGQGPDDMRIERVVSRLTTKHRIKRSVRSERRWTDSPLLGIEGSIQVRVRDQGREIHYPASPDDITAILTLLPRGICSGIREIEL